MPLQRNLLLKSFLSPPLIRYEDESMFPESSVSDVFTYSAFLENSEDKFWKIIIMSFVPIARRMLENAKLQTRCYMSYGKRTQKTEIEWNDIPEHQHGAYQSALLACTFEKKTTEPPLRVAVGVSGNETNLHWMRVHIPQGSPKAFLSFCLAPVLRSFTRLTLMVEFFSYYAAMGVEEFHLYLNNVTEDVKVLLHLLQSHGKIKTNFHRWDFDFNRTFVPSSGQLLALQDCVRRCKTSSKYVVNADIDEFIVPRKDQTLAEAITRLEQSNPNISLGSALIRHWFYCYEYPAEDLCLRRKPLLHTRALVARERDPWAYGKRSKYVVATKAAVIAGVHSVWALRPGWKELQVAESDLVVNHYRVCCDLYTASEDRTVLNSTEIVRDEAIRRLKWDIMETPAFQAIKKLIT